MLSNEVLTAVREDINKALIEVAQKNGLVYLGGLKITYSDSDFKISGSKFSVGGVDDYEKAEFEKNCDFYLIDKKAYLANLLIDGRFYEFIGFEPSRRKYPYKFRDLQTKKIILVTSHVIKEIRQNYPSGRYTFSNE